MFRDCIDIKYLTNSYFSSRTYWLSDDRQNKFWLVDCGDIEEVIKLIPAQSVIAGVLLTHVHYDLYGLNRLMKTMPDCVIYTNDFCQKSLTDPKQNFSRYHTDIDDFVFEHPEKVIVVGEGDMIELFEGVYADVYYTPGHDESCLCYEVEENLY